jgi:hypothetical protein
MNKNYCTFMFLTAVFALTACAPSEPVTYNHEKAGFRITVPAGWAKMSEDDEMYEFRSGDYKLIEVVGFDLELTEEDIQDLTDSEYQDMVRKAAIDGLEGYCEEAEITDYRIQQQYETTWGGHDAYRMKASGYSEAAEKSMVVDLLASFVMKKNHLFAYLLASQIAQDEYDATKSSLEACFASFRLIE